MFADRIELLMAENKLTKAEFANSLSLSRQTISNYLNDKRSPDSEVLLRIAQKYDVSVDWLLCLTDMRKQNRNFQDACVTLGISEKMGETIQKYSKGEYQEAFQIYMDNKEMQNVLYNIDLFIRYSKAEEAQLLIHGIHWEPQDLKDPVNLGMAGYGLMTLSNICNYFCKQAAMAFEEGLLSDYLDKR